MMSLLSRMNEINPEWKQGDMEGGVSISMKGEKISIKVSMQAEMNIPVEVVEDEIMGDPAKLSKRMTELLAERMELDLCIDWLPKIRASLQKVIEELSNVH